MEQPVTGRRKGGVARAENLTAARRSEIAKAGAHARKLLASLPRATHGDAEHPLRFGDISIPAYVLEDERRVLSLRGLTEGIGMSIGGDRHGTGDARIVLFIRSLEEKGIETNGLTARLKDPVEFQPARGGRSAYGYEATILVDICDTVLAARANGVLPANHKVAEKCEILIRGFARVGIIALIDEVTGFQRDRDRNNLARILEAFVAKEIQPYVKTFDPEYYENLFRLYNLPYPPAGNKAWRPQFFGKITNEVVYARLAPNLIPELKKVVSKAEKKALMHSALTKDIGHPKLREHLASIIAIQKLSKTPKEFFQNVDRVHHRHDQNLPLFDEADAPIPPPLMTQPKPENE